MLPPHISVLSRELLETFKEKKLRTFVDATLGAGGHSEAFLASHPEIELLIGIDQDPFARQTAEKRLFPWKKQLRLIPGNFRNLRSILTGLSIDKVDGIIFDLGVSSMQLDMPEKGFSFSKEGPLDMRMDPSLETSAEDIVNTWSEGDLGRIFREYGEEKKWRACAKTIVEKRKESRIQSTQQLVQVLRPCLHFSKKGINPLTLIFQALRIAVNRELEALEEAIPQAIACLSKGGRLGIISFHSLEDRIVKNSFRFAASDKMDTSGLAGVFLDKQPEVALLQRKPITPSDEEIAENPRSRSAKLRVIEKL